MTGKNWKPKEKKKNSKVERFVFCAVAAGMNYKADCRVEVFSIPLLYSDLLDNQTEHNTLPDIMESGLIITESGFITLHRTSRNPDLINSSGHHEIRKLLTCPDIMKSGIHQYFRIQCNPEQKLKFGFENPGT